MNDKCLSRIMGFCEICVIKVLTIRRLRLPISIIYNNKYILNPPIHCRLHCICLLDSFAGKSFGFSFNCRRQQRNNTLLWTSSCHNFGISQSPNSSAANVIEAASEDVTKWEKIHYSTHCPAKALGSIFFMFCLIRITTTHNSPFHCSNKKK